MLTQRFFGK